MKSHHIISDMTWTGLPRAGSIMVVATLLSCMASVRYAAEVQRQDQELQEESRLLNATLATHFFDDYEYMLPVHARQRGLAYLGSNERLRAAVDRYTKGGKLSIGIVGASISAGQGAGAIADNVYCYRFSNMVSSSSKPGYGPVTVLNGAVAGTVSMYMSVCVRNHVPSDVDLIVVEYSVNDPFEADFESDARKGFERLLRKLLRMPNKPAVVLLLSYSWRAAHGNYYGGTAEADFLTLASYYGLPALSVRAAVHEYLQEGIREGFWTNGTSCSEDNQHLARKLWQCDRIHPGPPGHKAFAELLYHLYNETLAGLARQPVTEEERQRAGQLKPPMVSGNYEAQDNRCLIGVRFKDAVVLAEGFEYVNEGKEDGRPKWGYVASQPGSKLGLKMSTAATSGNSTAQVTIELAHLKSYEGMGQASVTCSGGCACAESKFDGHHQPQNSQLFLHTFQVQQAGECVVTVTVLRASSSRGHKVKVSGIMVSEQAGAKALVRSARAVEYVADIAARDKQKGGLFNVLNHAW